MGVIFYHKLSLLSSDVAALWKNCKNKKQINYKICIKQKIISNVLQLFFLLFSKSLHVKSFTSENWPGGTSGKMFVFVAGCMGFKF